MHRLFPNFSFDDVMESLSREDVAQAGPQGLANLLVQQTAAPPEEQPKQPPAAPPPAAPPPPPVAPKPGQPQQPEEDHEAQVGTPPGSALVFLVSEPGAPPTCFADGLSALDRAKSLRSVPSGDCRRAAPERARPGAAQGRHSCSRHRWLPARHATKLISL